MKFLRPSWSRFLPAVYWAYLLLLIFGSIAWSVYTLVEFFS